MTGPTRMSPLTALFLGIFGTGAVAIACGTAMVLFGMGIIDSKAGEVLRFAEGTIDETLVTLPKLLESLPETIDDLFNDRRAPDYADSIDVEADFVVDERSGGLRPVLSITNEGDRVVTLLAVRLAALDEHKRPLGEWTEVVATPVAIDNDWRGLLMPGKTRHVVTSSWRSLPTKDPRSLSPHVEISEIRVWQGDK